MIEILLAIAFFAIFIFILIKDKRTVLLGLSLNTSLIAVAFALNRWKNDAVLTQSNTEYIDAVNVFTVVLILYFAIPLLVSFVLTSFYSIKRIWRNEHTNYDWFSSIANVLIALGLVILPIVGQLNPESVTGLIAGIVFMVLATSAILYHSYLLTALFNYINLGRKDLDYILILGSRLDENGKVEGLLQNRCDRGFDLHMKNPGSKIIVSGGLSPNPKTQVTEADGMAEYIEAIGVAPENILIEDKAQSTIENIEFSKLVIEDDSKVAVVTNSFHLLRALLISRRRKIENIGYAAKTPVARNAYGFFHEFTKYLSRTPLLPRVYIIFVLLIFLLQDLIL